MEELEELAHALAHQSRACNLTAPNHQRIHAYAMVADLATLETRIYKKGYTDIASDIEKIIDKCLLCMKSTASTGRCIHCSKTDLLTLEERIKKLPRTEWKDLLKEQRPKTRKRKSKK